MKRYACFLTVFLIGGLIGSLIATPTVNSNVFGAEENVAFWQNVAQQSVAPIEITQENSSYRDVVKAVLPAVVSIDVRGKAIANESIKKWKGRFPAMPGLDAFPFPEEFRDFFKDLPKESFQFELPNAPTRGGGSGFIVDPEGLIVTNHHVVSGAENVTVRLHDGRTFTATDIKSDPHTDIAVLRINASDRLAYLQFGDSDAMEIGDRVLAVGAPFGLAGTVTHGIVSSKGRHFDPNRYEDYIQTDAAINPGNSGGPLVNLRGKVVGVNTLIKTRTGGFQGVGMAVSSNLAKHIMGQLVNHGKVRRAYLGVGVQTLRPEVAERLGVKNKKGVVVTKVLDNSPAAKAGLKEGDIITRLDGDPIGSSWELSHRIARIPADTTVNLTVLRDGATKNFRTVLAQQPENYLSTAGNDDDRTPSGSGAISVDSIGVSFADATPEEAKQFGHPRGTEGVLIRNVEPNSLGAIAGLRSGMLVMKIDDRAVESAEQARDAISKGSFRKGILLQVRSSETGVHYVLLRKSA